jgi:hypothetical protein
VAKAFAVPARLFIFYLADGFTRSIDALKSGSEGASAAPY